MEAQPLHYGRSERTHHWIEVGATSARSNIASAPSFPSTNPALADLLSLTRNCRAAIGSSTDTLLALLQDESLCAAMNFDAFMLLRSSPRRENLAENSSSGRSNSQKRQSGGLRGYPPTPLPRTFARAVLPSRESGAAENMLIC